MELLIITVQLLILLLIGYVFGTFNEKRHFRSIRKREKELGNILSFSTKRTPPGNTDQACLVSGNIVISIDYFKKISAALRSILGGRINAYETLVERARREAVLRMKEEAMQKGAHAVFNVKLETSSINRGYKGQIGSVEVFAYGTALIRQ